MPWDANMTFTETNVTATKNGTTIDLKSNPMTLEGRLDVTSITGTSPTLTIKFQESADGSTWTDLIQFPQVTAATYIPFALKASKRYIRYVMTIGGTSPSVSMTLRLK